jgi:hypothetical protein
MLTNEETGTEHGPTSGNALNRGALLDVKHNANKWEGTKKMGDTSQKSKRPTKKRKVLMLTKCQILH